MPTDPGLPAEPAAEPILIAAPGRAVSPKASLADHLRRWAALGILVATAAFFVGSRLEMKYDNCRAETQFAYPLKVEVTTTCVPLPVETILPLVLVVLALMWPDLASVEILGLGSVARRVQEQDGRQNELEIAQKQIENRIENTLAAYQNVDVRVDAGADPFIAVLAERVERLTRYLEQGFAAPSNDAGQLPTEVLVHDLQAEVRSAPENVLETVRPWVEIARRMNDPGFADLVKGRQSGEFVHTEPGLAPSDRALVATIENQFGPLDGDKLDRWRREDELPIYQVRSTLASGSAAPSEVRAVATRMARLLVDDLKRLELMPAA